MVIFGTSFAASRRRSSSNGLSISDWQRGRQNWTRPPCLVVRHQNRNSVLLLAKLPESRWSERSFSAACRTKRCWPTVSMMCYVAELKMGLAKVQILVSGHFEAIVPCSLPSPIGNLEELQSTVQFRNYDGIRRVATNPLRTKVPT